MDNFIFKTKPYDHQLEALVESCDKKEYAHIKVVVTLLVVKF